MTDEAHRQVVVILLFEKATQDSILTHHTEHSLKLQHFLDKALNNHLEFIWIAWIPAGVPDLQDETLW